MPNASMSAVYRLLDTVIVDEAIREKAKLEVLRLNQKGELTPLWDDLRNRDPWTDRARPMFLYVIYVLLLWAIPIGLTTGVQPDLAEAIARGMRNYFNSLPEPLYTLFGTGYLGYTAARAWGKAKGLER